MELFYYKDPKGNFGDDLNEWLWDELIPGFRNVCDDVTIFGVGTIINKRNLIPFRNKRVLFLGSGVGYGEGVTTIDPEWDFRAVRGPVSAESIGLPFGKALVDPAVLLPDLDRYSGLMDAPRKGVIFIPHHVTDNNYKVGNSCAATGIEYISPAQDADVVIRKIASAEMVIAESMHAAIIADAFRVPWVPVKIGCQILPSKWEDWAKSLDMYFDIIQPRFHERALLYRFFPKVKRALGGAGRLHRKVRYIEEVLISVIIRRSNSEKIAMLSDLSKLTAKKSSLLVVLKEIKSEYNI